MGSSGHAFVIASRGFPTSRIDYVRCTLVEPEQVQYHCTKFIRALMLTSPKRSKKPFLRKNEREVWPDGHLVAVLTRHRCSSPCRTLSVVLPSLCPRTVCGDGLTFSCIKNAGILIGRIKDRLGYSTRSQPTHSFTLSRVRFTKAVIP